MIIKKYRETGTFFEKKDEKKRREIINEELERMEM